MRPDFSKESIQNNLKFAGSYWPTAVVWGISIVAIPALIFLLHFLFAHSAPALDFLYALAICLLLSFFVYCLMMAPVFVKAIRAWHKDPFTMLCLYTFLLLPIFLSVPISPPRLGLA
jgi:hypothetical protein